MCEARVFWHYECPICGTIYPYGMFAGKPVRVCVRCKEEKTEPKKCSEEKTEPKKCSDCRKYETKLCPPWPVKGPDHWCTQYDSRGVE